MKISSCKKIDLGKFYALYFNILNKVIIVYHIVNYTGLPTNDETSKTTGEFKLSIYLYLGFSATVNWFPCQ